MCLFHGRGRRLVAIVIWYLDFVLFFFCVFVCQHQSHAILGKRNSLTVFAGSQYVFQALRHLSGWPDSQQSINNYKPQQIERSDIEHSRYTANLFLIFARIVSARYTARFSCLVQWASCYLITALRHDKNVRISYITIYIVYVYMYYICIIYNGIDETNCAHNC